MAERGGSGFEFGTVYGKKEKPEKPVMKLTGSAEMESPMAVVDDESDRKVRYVSRVKGVPPGEIYSTIITNAPPSVKGSPEKLKSWIDRVLDAAVDALEKTDGGKGVRAAERRSAAAESESTRLEADAADAARRDAEERRRREYEEEEEKRRDAEETELERESRKKETREEMLTSLNELPASYAYVVDYGEILGTEGGTVVSRLKAARGGGSEDYLPDDVGDLPKNRYGLAAPVTVERDGYEYPVDVAAILVALVGAREERLGFGPHENDEIAVMWTPDGVPISPDDPYFAVREGRRRPYFDLASQVDEKLRNYGLDTSNPSFVSDVYGVLGMETPEDVDYAFRSGAVRGSMRHYVERAIYDIVSRFGLPDWPNSISSDVVEVFEKFAYAEKKTELESTLSNLPEGEKFPLKAAVSSLEEVRPPKWRERGVDLTRTRLSTGGD